MTKEITINPEGVASVIAAEATPGEAFADLARQSAHFGITDREFRDLAVAYFDARGDNLVEKKDAYVSAFHAAMTQWIVRLVRFGGYSIEDLPEIYHKFLSNELPKVHREFLNNLQKNSSGATIPDTRAAAKNSMESLYFALRVRGIDDGAILEAAKDAFSKTKEELGDPTTAGMGGVSALGGVEAIATNLAGLYSRNVSPEDVKEVALTFWTDIHSDGIDEKYVWKKAFFGVCTQWCYRLSLEAGFSGRVPEVFDDYFKQVYEGSEGRTKESLVNEALESANDYLIVCGLTQDEVIQEAKKFFDFE